MLKIITAIYTRIAAWFKAHFFGNPAANTLTFVEMIPTSVEPLPIVKTFPDIVSATPRRAKWVKPKGERPAPKPSTKSERKPRAPRPKVLSDEDPEKWGQFYFRDAILDQLDVYFTYLKRMKHGDREEYELHRRLGIQIMPGSAINAFSDWRKSGEMDELDTWWKENRPSFGAVSYGIDQYGLEEESINTVDISPEDAKLLSLEANPFPKSHGRLACLTGGDNTIKSPTTGEMIKTELIWVPKFIYFTKYKRPPPEIQRISEGDVYQMTVYWDRIDNRSKKWQKTHKGGVPHDYAVCVERGTAKVRVLNMLIKSRIALRHRSGRGRGETFYIPSTHWGVPLDCLRWAVGRHDASPEDYLRRVFIETALMYQSSVLGSMVRIEVKKGDLVATFGVEIKRMAYFFKDRDVKLNQLGSTARIFHIVRPHVRKNGTSVKMHFRGLREFEWAGYKVSISVPVRDHFSLPEVDFGAKSILKENQHQKDLQIKVR